MFNMFSGGALSRFTIFALGIMPYISASIIMQLLAIVSPQLEALKKEGQAGVARSRSTRATAPWCWRPSRRSASRCAGTSLAW
jgi:preprotein translocase subunit SecY